MEHLELSKDGSIATVTLNRGKVNAINERVVEELFGVFRELADDPDIGAIVFTGKGHFFTYGFDIPEFLGYSKDAFIGYLVKFTDFYRYLFLYPKPVVAALNGHAIAGGCMLAMACDYRIMVSGKAKISLNEINFGSSLFAGSIEMLKRLLGQQKAGMVALNGSLFSAVDALRIGLIDQVVTEADLSAEAKNTAMKYAQKAPAAFRSIKTLLRKPVTEDIINREKQSIYEFVDIWYSEETWKQLKEKVIYKD
jgi:enoyl-CoA hydratase/carnithine racemase